MQFGSTSKNINILTVCSTIVFVAGFTQLEMFTLSNILISIISFYVLNILGIWMTLHRYYSHKSFEFKSQYIKWLFTIIAALAGRGSALGWVYLHRLHHAHSDTVEDPHSPKFLGYRLFGFDHFKKQEGKMKMFLVKDLMTKEHLFIHKWYMLIIGAFILFLSLISFETLYFAWIVPAVLIQVSQHNFNYFGHMYGDRNQDANDNSRNNKFLFPIILGEAWHSNHHADPKNYTTKKQRFEYDPVALVIEAVKR